MSGALQARPLRIAYLSGSPRISTRDDAGVSGPRAHIRGLIDALRDGGHEVDEYVLGDLLPRAGTGTDAPGRAGGSRARQVAVDVVRLATRGPVAWHARRRLRGRYDVAYERYALFHQLGWPFRRRGAAWVIEANAVLSQEARLERGALALQRIAGRLERRSYRRADLVVCVSEPLRALVVDQLGVAEDRVVVIPNAVDPRRFDPERVVAAGVVADGLVVGYVGFVVERQGLDDLLHAVARLRRDGVAVSAVIVGDGPARPGLEELARTLGVGDAVEFRGQVPWPEIPAQIASFAVAYSGQRGVGGMPMYHSPLKIYEYLAMGRPVLASHHPDAQRTLVASGAGWTFPAGDRQALAGTLREVARMAPSELSGWGERARAHATATHTWTHRVDQLLAELAARGLLP